ncbi:hypothetical protein FH972_025103 [Carpinus fangiana]|uniref:Uncharacterized protein n=1 Tax=Carpinus fangiana TaxID=176857 RepID=A0A5N6L023_9ROSI|nr:hypothetical protein FH972_025103 [Carpinus fangiana]
MSTAPSSKVTIADQPILPFSSALPADNGNPANGSSAHSGDATHPSAQQPSPRGQAKPISKSWSLSILGVAIALVALAITIYYGQRQTYDADLSAALAVWEAQKDFREACSDDKALGLQLSNECRQALSRPTESPPITRRWLKRGTDCVESILDLLRQRESRESLRASLLDHWAVNLATLIVMTSLLGPVTFGIYRRHRYVFRPQVSIVRNLPVGPGDNVLNPEDSSSDIIVPAPVPDFYCVNDRGVWLGEGLAHRFAQTRHEKAIAKKLCYNSTSFELFDDPALADVHLRSHYPEPGEHRRLCFDRHKDFRLPASPRSKLSLPDPRVLSVDLENRIKFLQYWTDYEYCYRRHCEGLVHVDSILHHEREFGNVVWVIPDDRLVIRPTFQNILLRNRLYQMMLERRAVLRSECRLFGDLVSSTVKRLPPSESGPQWENPMIIGARNLSKGSPMDAPSLARGSVTRLSHEDEQSDVDSIAGSVVSTVSSAESMLVWPESEDEVVTGIYQDLSRTSRFSTPDSINVWSWTTRQRQLRDEMDTITEMHPPRKRLELPFRSSRSRLSALRYKIARWNMVDPKVT